jgi:hypothetical protein
MTDIDKQTIIEASKSIADLLTVHWDEIKGCADSDEKSAASVALTLKLSFLKQVPVGVATISFAARVKDSVSFSGEQLKLKGVAE